MHFRLFYLVSSQIIVGLIKVAIVFSVMTRTSPSIEHMSLVAFLASLPMNVTQKWDNYDDPVDTNKVDLDISQDQISCLIRPHIGNPDRIDGFLT